VAATEAAGARVAAAVMGVATGVVVAAAAVAVVVVAAAVAVVVLSSCAHNLSRANTKAGCKVDASFVL
jgi:hypothetical protein